MRGRILKSRLGQPDTDADRELRECLDEEPLSSFIMVSGAGSGKTTSLVKALDHLEKTRGVELRRRSQQIACITYTEIAVEEIWNDVGNAPLFHVSTIHSFLWTVVRSLSYCRPSWFTSFHNIGDSCHVPSNSRSRFNGLSVHGCPRPKKQSRLEV